eukprot:6877996-Lingulodinium_polyedra.AAC.1
MMSSTMSCRIAEPAKEERPSGRMPVAPLATPAGRARAEMCGKGPPPPEGPHPQNAVEWTTRVPKGAQAGAVIL